MISEHASESRGPLRLWRIGVVAGACLAASTAAAQALPQNVPSLAPMIERVSPAVVNISVNGRIELDNPLADDPFFRRFLDPNLVPDEREFESAGSGVIVDAENGYVLTNNHVVENAEHITVTLLDDRSMDAAVVGTDPGSDLALLKIEADRLVEIGFADSSEIRVGDFVVAIGNPFGFSHTVTSGIVSGLGRSQVSPDPNAYQDFIQTDASINPGNSGGALVDLNGSLVGINSAIISRSGGNIGIGFAIPANMARDVMNQLAEFGEVSRGLLGVRVSPITPEIAETYDLPTTAGALVAAVSADSAAEQAGIRIYDVIVSVNDQPVHDPGSLRSAIGMHRPGDRVRVGVIRDGRAQSIMAVLGELTAAPITSERGDESGPALEPPPESLAEIDPVFEGVRFRSGRGREPAGLYVAEIEMESAAYERGLRDGDLIARINREPVRELADAARIVKEARTVILQVRRGEREQLIVMR